MQDFKYYAPTKVFFGKNAEDNIGPALNDLGVKKVLLHYGQKSAEKSGLLDRVRVQLDSAGVGYTELGGVEANPKIGLIREGCALSRSENVDFLLAVGGGSVIDSCKAIALAVGSGIDDPWDIFARKTAPAKALPVGAVLTIAAAGSEMSDSVVITNPDIPQKRGYNTDLVRPAVAFMNPENTYSVPPYQTACGIVDIMMHTLERYYSAEERTDLTEYIAEALLLAVKEAGHEAMKDPHNYEARSTLMWASSLSHNGLTGCGKSLRGLTVHQLAHAVGGLHDNVAHGAALAVLYPAWSRFMYKYDTRRFCRIAKHVWQIPFNEYGSDRELTSLAGIQAMKGYFKSLGMPITLSELGVSPDEYGTLADMITMGGTITIPSYIPIGREEILEIFSLAE